MSLSDDSCAEYRDKRKSHSERGELGYCQWFCRRVQDASPIDLMFPRIDGASNVPLWPPVPAPENKGRDVGSDGGRLNRSDARTEKSILVKLAGL